MQQQNTDAPYSDLSLDDTRALGVGLAETVVSLDVAQSEAIPEKVRLVIWDLDETFWNGTLTEGGINYVEANHDIVIELAKRGIVSSICSRNEHSVIEALLRERGIWDYFVFPSIDWSNKGPRLKQIVENSQLRAPTVLFIDDNAMNRAEAARFVGGIQVAGPEMIANLLDNPRLQGKEDSGLTRLSQYKLLERRAEDKKIIGDGSEFLRESGIKVYIEYNVEDHLDRAVELINRTNQLNFTKIRLSEDGDIARGELSGLLANMDIQAGLVRVYDRYGDYGYCGLYIQKKWLHGTRPKLIHYCFSCRTLGMEIETWLYQKLGKPEIEISGDVLTNIFQEKNIDWVRLETADPSISDSSQSSSFKVPSILMRGGCESVAVAHYFEMLTDNLISEFAFQRDRIEIRRDHSQMLRLSVDKLKTEEMEALFNLGYIREDFETKMIRIEEGELSVSILALWSEINPNMFRHKRYGFRTPVYIHNKFGIDANNIKSFDLSCLRVSESEKWMLEALTLLKSDYEVEGQISSEHTRENIALSLNALTQESAVFLLGATEKTRSPSGSLATFQPHVELNAVLKSFQDYSKRVIFLDIDEFIKSNDERHEGHNHYSREVYFRLFSGIKERISELL